MKQDIVVGSSSCSAIVFCDRENKSPTAVYIKKREAHISRNIFPTIELRPMNRNVDNSSVNSLTGLTQLICSNK